MREKFSGIRALTMFAVCSLCILSATAQTLNYKILPSSIHCEDKVKILTNALEVITFPPGQRFLLACDDDAWRLLERSDPDLLNTHHAGTIRETHTTMIRGMSLTKHIDAYGFIHVLRHEAWHMKLDTDEEAPVVAATAKEEMAPGVVVGYMPTKQAK